MTFSSATPRPDTPISDGATQALAQAASEDRVFEQASITELIRHTPGKKSILRGTLAGEPVVFRIYDDAPDACQRHWNELTRIWPMMNTGQAQICRPVAWARKAGVLAMADVPGTPLMELLYRSDPGDRAQWLAPSVRWLRLYTECSETEQEATPAGWATRAARAAAGQAFWRLRKVESLVLKEIERLVPLIEGGRWRVAIGHGDFHPNNLIAGPFPTLTGIDCGGSRAMPIYKDMARFLMHMGRRGLILSGERFLGVDRVGLDTFAEAFDLTEKERQITLPFFLAVEALLRVETRSLSNSRVRRAREMTKALLEDLQDIGL